MTDERPVAILCGVPEAGFAVERHCGWCDKKTKMLHQVVYGGYGSNVTCGECGTLCIDGEYDPRPKRGEEFQRAEERKLKVAKAWENGDQSAALSAYLESCLRDVCEEDEPKEETK